MRVSFFILGGFTVIIIRLYSFVFHFLLSFILFITTLCVRNFFDLYIIEEPHYKRNMFTE